MKKQQIPPTILIIFGITGDLSRTKLIPALYGLEKAGVLPEHFYIFGTSRKEMDDKQSAKILGSGFDPTNQQVFQRLLKRIRMIRFDVTNSEDYPELKLSLDTFMSNTGVNCNVLMYLAIPPEIVSAVISELGVSKLNRTESEGTESRLLLEKPFGSNLHSAKTLVKTLQKNFKEKQLYRIDHYLAKETVQNILTIRKDNPWLKALWSSRHIKTIEISAFEDKGAQGRATFYEQTGALRDMIQSHLLQLLAITTMYIPAKMNEDTLSRARLDILKSIKPIRLRKARGAIRGQYRGYRKEAKAPKSHTETFASVPIAIDQSAWRKTRVRLMTGKALARKETRISVAFSDFAKPEHQNVLTFRIQPEEGVAITLVTRKAGTPDEPELLTLNYPYPGTKRFPDAYESVLYGALIGDRTLFPTSDEVIASWKIVNPLLKRWLRKSNGLIAYPAGSKPGDILSR